jgi:hypothetical protein
LGLRDRHLHLHLGILHVGHRSSAAATSGSRFSRYRLVTFFVDMYETRPARTYVLAIEALHILIASEYGCCSLALAR